MAAKQRIYVDTIAQIFMTRRTKKLIDVVDQKRLNNHKYIANHYGVDIELDQAIEELAELIVAIRKFKRNRNSVDGYETSRLLYHVAEEIADVEIVTTNIKLLLPFVDSDVEKIKDEKLDRQIKRINAERR